MDIQELAAEFSYNSDQELLRLSLNTDTLAPYAQSVSGAVTKRGLNPTQSAGTLMLSRHN